MHSTEIGCNFDSSITVAIEMSVNGECHENVILYIIYIYNIYKTCSQFLPRKQLDNNLRKSDNSR